MKPISLADSRGIDYVSQVVLRVCEDKGGVIDSRSSIRERGLFSWRNVRGNLRCINRSLRAGQANESFIEVVEPGAQYRASIVSGIGGNKNDCDLISDVARQFLERRSEIGHVHGTDVRASRIAEKQERDATLCLCLEIEGRA